MILKKNPISKDWVHPPIDTQASINGWPLCSKQILYLFVRSFLPLTASFVYPIHIHIHIISPISFMQLDIPPFKTKIWTQDDSITFLG